MCGIAGFFYRKGIKSDHLTPDLNNMLVKIHHRGPNDTGVCGFDGETLVTASSTKEIWCGVRGICGFNRLSIQDVSDAGHQPMISEDCSVCLTFNGEIYNVEELRKMLLNDFGVTSFQGHSDTEVILQLYLHMGFNDMVQVLNGMFAIVLLDVRSEKEQLYMARDRFGIIPLHILIDENTIIWSSEIKAFLALSSFKRELNPLAISKSFQFCYPNDSMYRNVESVAPGTYIAYQYNIDDINTMHYFDINEYQQDEGKWNGNRGLEDCENVLRRCVERQLISDVPVGVQFSGGVDSTLLASYVSDIYVGRKDKLRGFSLINKNYPRYDEEKWIDLASSRLKLDVKKWEMDELAFARFFEKSLYAFERFVNIPSPVGIYIFSMYASKDITVLISGEGADELCGGYGSFSAAQVMKLADQMCFHRLPSRFYGYIPDQHNLDFFKKFDRMLTEDTCRKIYPAFQIQEDYMEKRKYWNSLNGTLFDKLRKFYFKEELVSLLERQNKVCMANSVENRVPFLDNEFVELMFRIPEKYLLHPQYAKVLTSKRWNKAYEGKYLLKKMSEKRYGRNFAYRDKQAIRVPLAEYIFSPHFKQYLDSHVIASMRSRGLIDMHVFDEAFSSIEKSENAMVIWKAINFEVWMQLFVDGRKVIDL